MIRSFYEAQNHPADPTPTLNTGLLTMLAEDSRAAFHSIYNQYFERVYKLSLRYLKLPELAQEVVQEVFLKLWTERTRIRCDLPVEAWLYTVAKNNIYNRFKRTAVEKKAKNHLQIFEPQVGNLGYDRLANADCQRIMHKALASLSESQHKVYQMAKEENLSYLQIAAHLNVSKLTVKTHMARARKTLRQYFNQSAH